jgi:hypothetical protein
MSKMEETLDMVMKKLTNIKGWYTKNKDVILSGKMSSDKTLGKYYSELITIGQFMSNLARGLTRVGTGDGGVYDGVVYDLLNNNYLKGTEK